ncbi:VOC family protein [Streptomyces sp. NPDC020412]|uniref:VOC family protein n=1 Tax=Streptomyces sp. NPDC020412 TaxID=3365073 RepID=UPI003797CE53
MSPRPVLATVVLDCADAHALADFYRGLLGWDVRDSEPDWVLIEAPGGEGVRLALQGEEGYVPPVWPEAPGAQQKMLHLDIRVDDLAEGVRHAVALGAREAAHQPQGDVRVLFDPAGHPFCLFVDA